METSMTTIAWQTLLIVLSIGQTVGGVFLSLLLRVLVAVVAQVVQEAPVQQQVLPTDEKIAPIVEPQTQLPSPPQTPLEPLPKDKPQEIAPKAVKLFDDAQASPVAEKSPIKPLPKAVHVPLLSHTQLALKHGPTKASKLRVVISRDDLEAMEAMERETSKSAASSPTLVGSPDGNSSDTSLPPSPVSVEPLPEISAVVQVDEPITPPVRAEPSPPPIIRPLPPVDSTSTPISLDVSPPPAAPITFPPTPPSRSESLLVPEPTPVESEEPVSSSPPPPIPQIKPVVVAGPSTPVKPALDKVAPTKPAPAKPTPAKRDPVKRDPVKPASAKQESTKPVVVKPVPVKPANTAAQSSMPGRSKRRKAGGQRLPTPSPPQSPPEPPVVDLPTVAPFVESVKPTTSYISFSTAIVTPPKTPEAVATAIPFPQTPILRSPSPAPPISPIRLSSPVQPQKPRLQELVDSLPKQPYVAHDIWTDAAAPIYSESTQSWFESRQQADATAPGESAPRHPSYMRELMFSLPQEKVDMYKKIIERSPRYPGRSGLISDWQARRELVQLERSLGCI